MADDETPKTPMTDAKTHFPSAAVILHSTEAYFESLKKAGELLIGHFGVNKKDQKTEMKNKLEAMFKAAKSKLDAIDKTQLAPSKKLLETIDTLQKRYYNDLAYYLALALPPLATKTDKPLDIDADLFEAMTFVSWTTREKTETKYQRETEALSLTEEPVYHFTKALAEEYVFLVETLNPELGLDKKEPPEWYKALPQWEKNAIKAKVQSAYEKAINDMAVAEPSADETSPPLQSSSRSRSDSTDSAEALAFIQQAAIPSVNPEKQKTFLQKFAENMGTASAGNRKFPGLRNFSKHHFTVEMPKWGEQGIQSFAYATFRSSTPLPIKIKNKAERQRVLQLNFDQFESASSQPQTTITAEHYDPTQGGNTLLYTGLVSNIGPEASIISNMRTGIQTRNEQATTPPVKHLYANHAINIRLLSQAIKLDATAKEVIGCASEKLKKGFSSYLSDENVNFCDRLQTQLTNWLKNPSSKHYEACKQTLNSLISKVKQDLTGKTGNDKARVLRRLLFLHSFRDYITLIHQSPSLFSDRNPNLYLAALEQILVGRTLGSCKSGKDREAQLLTHRDTMIQHFFLSDGDYLPCFDEKDPIKRGIFVTRYVDNLLSYHEQQNASLNFGGMLGLKNSGGILARDILQEIKEREKGAQTLLGEDKIASFLAIQKICAKRNDMKLSLGRRIKAFLGKVIQRLGQRLLEAFTKRYSPEAALHTTSSDTTPPTPIRAISNSVIDLTDNRRHTAGKGTLDERYHSDSANDRPENTTHDHPPPSPNSSSSNN